ERTDSTAREQEEDRLREGEASQAAIIESALDSIITIDAAGLVVAWNAAAERAFGYPRQEAVGRELAELIVPPTSREAHRAGLGRFLQTGEGPLIGRRVELCAHRKDGSSVPVEAAIIL